MSTIGKGRASNSSLTGNIRKLRKEEEVSLSWRVFKTGEEGMMIVFWSYPCLRKLLFLPIWASRYSLKCLAPDSSFGKLNIWYFVYKTIEPLPCLIPVEARMRFRLPRNGVIDGCSRPTTWMLGINPGLLITGNSLQA